MCTAKTEMRANASRQSYLTALTAEIRLLVRAIASDPTKRLSDLSVRWQLPGADGKPVPADLNYPQVVNLLVRSPVKDEEILEHIGALQAVRDSLIRLTNPATGYSLAYTSLVVGSELGGGSEGNYELARTAYGCLALTSRLHRWFMFFLAALAITMAVFASWEATKASLGRGLLQGLEPLRAQQTLLAADKHKLEADVRASNKPEDMPLLTVCEQFKLARENKTATSVIQGLTLPPAKIADTFDICGRDAILVANFNMVHDGLGRYLVDWPGMVGGLYAPVAHAAGRLLGYLHLPAETQVVNGDIEFYVAPVVQVIAGFILPFTFGIIGSLLYVLLQHYTAVRENLLVPRDHALAYLRVVLGVVVAACVSMLMTSASGPAVPLLPAISGSTPPSALIGSLSLTGNLVTFLAGFGAEAVFTLLQALVQRVFAAPTERPSAQAGLLPSSTSAR